MTPRQVDVRFVLEGVAGVVEVYALDRPDFAFAVKLKDLGGAAARAHCALLRVLSHEECGEVLFVEVGLPPSFHPRARRLELSVADREAARARVPETIPEREAEAEPIQAVAPAPQPARKRFRTLIIDADVDVAHAVDATFGDDAEHVVEPDPVAAFWKAQDGDFDLVLLDSRLAFGREGVLPGLWAVARPVARRVVLLAREGERDLLFASLDELHCWSPILTRPFEPEVLLEIIHTRPGNQHWRIPVPRPRRPAVVEPAQSEPVRRILVVDDDPATGKLLASMSDGPVRFVVTSDAWEAVDLVAEPDWALVVCSATMKTLGGAPFYRLVWNARPDLKSRFVFIVGPDMVPSSATDGSPPTVLERPLTLGSFSELVMRVSQPPIVIQGR